jgi:hypothetical protein
MRASGTVTSFEIAAAAMRDKGLDPDNDPVTRTDFVQWGDTATQRFGPQGQDREDRAWAPDAVEASQRLAG